MENKQSNDNIRTNIGSNLDR